MKPFLPIGWPALRWLSAHANTRILLLTAFGIGILPGSPAVHVVAAESHDATELSISNFLHGPVLRWEIQIPTNGIVSLHNEPRTVTPCDVRIGTRRFRKVGVHIKGSAGSIRSIHENSSLTLKFDWYITNQTCFGLRKVYLDNSVQDGSRLGEYVCSHLYQKAGIPVPRVSHALVRLNKRDLGLYVLKEGWDKLVLQRGFGDASGNFYEGGFCQDIDQPLERDFGEGEVTREDLQGLYRAVRLREHEKRISETFKRVDRERFLTFTALQILTDDWNGYVGYRNNYRIYHDPNSDRLVFLPHGMDEVFSRPSAGIDFEMRGVVAERVFEVPSMRQELDQRILNLSSNVFTLPVLTNRIAEAERRVLPALAYNPEQHKYVRKEMADFRRRVNNWYREGFSPPARRADGAY